MPTPLQTPKSVDRHPTIAGSWGSPGAKLTAENARPRASAARLGRRDDFMNCGLGLTLGCGERGSSSEWLRASPSHWFVRPMAAGCFKTERTISGGAFENCNSGPGPPELKDRDERPVRPGRLQARPKPSGTGTRSLGRPACRSLYHGVVMRTMKVERRRRRPAYPRRFCATASWSLKELSFCRAPRLSFLFRASASERSRVSVRFEAVRVAMVALAATSWSSSSLMCCSCMRRGYPIAAE